MKDSGSKVFPAKKQRRENKLTPYLFLLPTILLMGTFIYYPFVKTIGTSFFLTNATGKAVEFIGLENYQKIFSDSLFIQSIKNTFIYALIQVPVTIVLAFLMAMAANKKRKASWFYELTFAFPMAVSMSVAALIFKLMLNPQIGIINHIFGLDVQWFNGEKTALLSVIILGVWLGLGMDFLYLLSAVRSVPDDLIEAARIDGANALQRMFFITLPCIMPVLMFCLMNLTIDSVRIFTEPYILTSGGPGASSMSVIQYLYTSAFETFKMGYASAMGYILTLFLVFVSVFYFKTLRRQSGV